MSIAEAQSTVAQFVAAQGLTFRNLRDESGDVARLYRVRGIPASFFIDREGVIAATHVGALTEALIDAYWRRIR